MVFVRNPSAALTGAALEIYDEPPVSTRKWYQF
jgi:hypothetical protein